jgi:site-specific DNA recombinase
MPRPAGAYLRLSEPGEVERQLDAALEGIQRVGGYLPAIEQGMTVEEIEAAIRQDIVQGQHSQPRRKHGWPVPGVYWDLRSAYKRGVRRKGFERCLDDAEAGVFTILGLFDADRLTRDPDLDNKRIIDLGEQKGLVIASDSGDYFLAKPADQEKWRIETARARRESQQRAKRVQEVYDRKVRKGQRLRIGRRPFGWAPDRDTPLTREVADRLNASGQAWTIKGRPSDGGAPVDIKIPFTPEADYLLDAGRRFADGVASLRRIVREWDAAGIRTTTGHAIDQSMLRKMLLKPRNELIFGPDLHRRIQAVLADSARRTQQGTARKHLLSGFLRCSFDPKHRMTGYVDVGRKHRKGRAAERKRAYHCSAPPAGCNGISRLADELERLVCELVCRLVEAEADILESASVEASDEERALHDRWEALALNIKRYTADYRAGTLSPEDRNTFTAEDQAEIEEIKGKLAERKRGRIRKNVDRDKVRQRMGDAQHQDNLGPLEERRALLAAYIQHIVLWPAVRGRKQFDPTKVEEPVWQEDINTAKASAIWHELVRETLAAMARTRCKNRHLLDEANRCVRSSRGRSYVACRQCLADAQERHRRKVDNRCPVCTVLIDPRATRCWAHARRGPAKRR